MVNFEVHIVAVRITPSSIVNYSEQTILNLDLLISTLRWR